MVAKMHLQQVVKAQRGALHGLAVLRHLVVRMHQRQQLRRHSRQLCAASRGKRMPSARKGDNISLKMISVINHHPVTGYIK